MFSALKKRLFGPSVTTPPLPAIWHERLRAREAAALRDALRAAMADDEYFPLAALLDAAQAAGWSEIERDKLAAYGEYFSGQAALAHSRVMDKGLADTDYPLFITALAQCYQYDRFAEGYALLKRFRADVAQGIDPALFNTYAGYIVYCGGGPIEEACRHFDAALAAGQPSAMLIVNAYEIYFQADRQRETDLLRRLMTEHLADDAQANYALACVELAQGHYPEGFRLAEARYDMAHAWQEDYARNPRLKDRPHWQGEPLAGRRLLVLGEQGLGDIIMMSRYLLQLAGADGEIVFDCREAAVSLLAHNFPAIHCVSFARDRVFPVDFDVWIGSMSLPHLFATTVETVPARGGYLTVPPEQAAYWRGRCAELARHGAPRIGLAWSGNPGHRYDRRRSLRLEQLIEPLRHHSGVDFFALQTAVPPDLPANLINLADEMMTLADTAAIIAEMDLIITVDTSIVHLAGALGKPTWLLLPHRYEWRWGLEGEDNPWYESVRVLRQRRHGDWTSVLDEAFGARLTSFMMRKHTAS